MFVKLYTYYVPIRKEIRQYTDRKDSILTKSQQHDCHGCMVREASF